MIWPGGFLNGMIRRRFGTDPANRRSTWKETRMIRGAFAVVFLSVSVSSASDLDKLKGKWTAKVGANQDVEITVEFQDRLILVTVPDGNGGEIQLEGEYILDDKASPKKIDLIRFTSPDGQPIDDNLGIYEINEAGDELKLCTGGPGQDRPDAFVPAGNDGRGTVVLRKKK